MKLKPADFWELTLTELSEMIEAHSKELQRQTEAEYYRTAWLAANLMNATGNYKQHITPDKLLGINARNKQARQITLEERDRAFDELLKKFDR